jgi:hypothetical protein
MSTSTKRCCTDAERWRASDHVHNNVNNQLKRTANTAMQWNAPSFLCCLVDPPIRALANEPQLIKEVIHLRKMPREQQQDDEQGMCEATMHLCASFNNLQIQNVYSMERMHTIVGR